MRLVNLTPHPLVLRGPNEEVTLPPSGKVARVTQIPGDIISVEGLPVPLASPSVYGEVEDLPAPEQGTIYLVSAMVGSIAKRHDVLAPGTGPNDGAIRNEKGHIVAVTRLVSF